MRRFPLLACSLAEGEDELTLLAMVLDDAYQVAPRAAGPAAGRIARGPRLAPRRREAASCPARAVPTGAVPAAADSDTIDPVLFRVAPLGAVESAVTAGTALRLAGRIHGRRRRAPPQRRGYEASPGACVILLAMMSAAAWGACSTGTYELRYATPSSPRCRSRSAAGRHHRHAPQHHRHAVRWRGWWNPARRWPWAPVPDPTARSISRGPPAGLHPALALIEATPAPTPSTTTRCASSPSIACAARPLPAPPPPPGHAAPRAPVPSVPVPSVPGARAVPAPGARRPAAPGGFRRPPGHRPGSLALRPPAGPPRNREAAT